MLIAPQNSVACIAPKRCPTPISGSRLNAFQNVTNRRENVPATISLLRQCHFQNGFGGYLMKKIRSIDVVTSFPPYSEKAQSPRHGPRKLSPFQSIQPPCSSGSPGVESAAMAAPA